MAKRTANTLSIMEVLSLFATEADAVTWFEDVRWNGNPVCTHCGNTENLSRPKTRPDAYWCSCLSSTLHRPYGDCDGILSVFHSKSGP